MTDNANEINGELDCEVTVYDGAHSTCDMGLDRTETPPDPYPDDPASI